MDYLNDFNGCTVSDFKVFQESKIQQLFIANVVVEDS